MILKGPLSGDAADYVEYSYMIDLLPFLEEKPLFDRFDRDAMFCAEQNRPVIATVLPLAICPSAPHETLVASNKFQPTNRYVAWRTMLGLGTSGEPAPPPEPTPMADKVNPLFLHVYGVLDKRYTTTYDGAVTDYAVPINAYGTLASKLGYKTTTRAAGIPSMFPAARLDPEFTLKWLSLADRATSETFSVRMRAAQITDGLSHTFMMTEVAGRPDHWEREFKTNRAAPLLSAWAEPLASSFGLLGVKDGDSLCMMQCENADEVFSFHSRGANFVFADGHVDFLQEGISPQLLVALMTPDQGDRHEP